MILAALIACGGKDGGVDDGGPWGVIVAARGGETATVEVGAAWGFNSDSNGKTLLYLSPNPDADCAAMATALQGPNAGDDWDPAIITPPGTCSVFLYGDYPAQTSWDVTPDAPSTTMLVVLNCAMDEGVWEQSGDCEGGFCYTGHYWQGSPQSYTLKLEGGEGEDFAMELAMDDYAGGFTYESMDDAPASGAVQGSASAGWCSDFGESAYF